MPGRLSRLKNRYIPEILSLEDRLAPAVFTNYGVRFSATTMGDIVLIGNTVLTATDANAQNGVGSQIDNNDFPMVVVDVDGDGSTINSSRANFFLPDGATVLFAGLYWGGQSASNLRNQVSFDNGDGSGYDTITGVIIGSNSGNYQAFAEVTAQVRAGGSGIYTVGNVQANIGTGQYGGWSLVVVFSQAGLPVRQLTVRDGYAQVLSSDPDVSVVLDGFRTAASGTINAKLGFVSFDGDRGIDGDSVRLNSTTLSNALNPASNFFNSSITNLGADVTGSDPDFFNQLGLDIDTVLANGIIGNNATSATVTFSTSSDAFFGGVLTSAIDVLAPALTATKSVSDVNGGQAVRGDILQYTIVISNTGGDNARNIVFTDLIPAGTEFVRGSLEIVSGPKAGDKTNRAGDDQAEFSSANDRVVFRVGRGANASRGGKLDVGQSTTIRFNVKIEDSVADGTVITNLGTLDFVAVNSGQAMSGASNEVSVTVTARTDLAITKVVNNASPNVGDTVTFGITLRNNGPLTANDVEVTDLLPGGLTFVSATASQGTYNATTGIWDVGEVTTSTPLTLVIRATLTDVNASTNTATITASDLLDPVASNNSASTSFDDDFADVAVSMTVDDATPNVGQTVTYTVTITNNGDTDTTGVQVTDLLPAGLSGITANAPGGTSYDQNTGIWDIGALNDGQTLTLTISATVDGPDQLLNTATVTANSLFDPLPGNNFASALIIPDQADLALTKRVDNATPIAGSNIVYTVTIFNDGPNNATNVQVLDVLPAGVSFVAPAVPSTGTYNDATSIWTIPTLNSGASATLTITVTVNDVADIVNTARILTADQFDPLQNNNTATSYVDVQQTDLVIRKTVNTPRPNVNSSIAFTITLFNAGNITASGVTVRDLLPAGLTFTSSTPSQGSYSNTTGIWNVGNINAGQTLTLTINATVANADVKVNTASIVSSSVPDPNLANNLDTVTVTPQQADLQVLKIVDNNHPTLGSNVFFTITVTNAGPDTATGVTIRDLLPSGLTFVNDTPSVGTYNSGSGDWVITTLTPGQAATLILEATVNSTATLTNTASVLVSGQFDPISANNSASVSLSTTHADLDLTKTVNTQIAFVGRPVVFTFTIRNDGPDAATDVVVVDPFPTTGDLTFVGTDNPTQGSVSFAANNLTWNVGTLGAGASATMQVTAIVTAAGEITNTITATEAEFDPVLANNSSTVTFNAFLGPDQVTKRDLLSGSEAAAALASNASAAAPPARASQQRVAAQSSQNHHHQQQRHHRPSAKAVNQFFSNSSSLASLLSEEEEQALGELAL